MRYDAKKQRFTITATLKSIFEIKHIEPSADGQSSII